MTEDPDKKPKVPKVSGPDPEETARPDEPKPEIDGYEIIDKLGEGGMGTVWRARQLSTHREVALKVTSAKAFRSERARARFEREVELASRLEHPHIARVYDSGLQRGAYYYAMELVTGQDLDTFVKEQSLTTDQILRLLHTVCLAVQYAHQRGVIHRDLKPSNILVTADAQPHILDFGLAKDILNAGEDKAVSLDGDIIGTPTYMSPEQAAGRLDDVDTRSDVYSLGVILYNLLTNDWPYDVSGTYYDVLKNIQDEEPCRPSKIAPSLDMDVEAILLKALAKEPDQRYQSMAQFAEDIQRRLEGLPVKARSVNTAYLMRKWVSRHRAATAVAGLVGIIIVSFSFLLGQQWRQYHTLEGTLGAVNEQAESQYLTVFRSIPEVLFFQFLEAWHTGDVGRTRWTSRMLSSVEGRAECKESRAMRLLSQTASTEPGKLSSMMRDLEGDQEWFVEFVIGEWYLKNHDPARAMDAYDRSYQKVCSVPKTKRPESELYRRFLASRLYEIDRVLKGHEDMLRPPEGSVP